MLSDALWSVMMRLIRLRDMIKGRTLQLVAAEALNAVDTDQAFTSLIDIATPTPSLVMLATATESGLGAQFG